MNQERALTMVDIALTDIRTTTEPTEPQGESTTHPQKQVKFIQLTRTNSAQHEYPGTEINFKRGCYMEAPQVRELSSHVDISTEIFREIKENGFLSLCLASFNEAKLTFVTLNFHIIFI